MRGAVAAGHPLTAGAGARVLAEGGNAVDACVAAAFAAAVAEGPLTGPAGGGFLLVHQEGETVVLDCFFAVPATRLGEMEEVLVDFAVITGSFVAAILIGISDIAGKYYVPQLGAFLIYLVMLAILMWRPAGLFGKR